MGSDSENGYFTIDFECNGMNYVISFIRLDFEDPIRSNFSVKMEILQSLYIRFWYAINICYLNVTRFPIKLCHLQYMGLCICTCF